MTSTNLDIRKALILIVNMWQMKECIWYLDTRLNVRGREDVPATTTLQLQD